MDEATFSDRLLGDLDFTQFDAEPDLSGGKSRFQMQADAGTIAGTIELHSGDVYIDLSKSPCDHGTAVRIVTDAILRGRTLGIRPTLANKIRAALEN